MTMIPREVLRLGDRIVMAGAIADRPAACPSAKGCLYFSTDESGGTLYRCDGTAWTQVAGAVAGGAGDVVGPASSVNGAIVLFDGLTGKLVKDSAVVLSAFGGTLVDDANAAAARATLGLVIGTDVQAYDAELAALAGLVSAADKGIQFTGAGTAAVYDLTAAGKALIDDADAAAQRTTLGLGTIATQAAANVSISGGSVTGITDLAIADGGTAASTAAGARVNILPALTGNTGKLLAVNGAETDVEWVAASSGGSTHRVVRKAVDESVTSSTVLQDDDDLTIPYAAGETWSFSVVLFVDGATAGDITFRFGGTVAGFAGQYGVIGGSASATWDTTAPESAAADSIEMIGGSGITVQRNAGCAGAGVIVTVMLVGAFVSAINPGTLVLQWAQRASSATATTVKAGSHLTAWKA